MTKTTMGNLINLSVNIIRAATDLLERSPLEFVPQKKAVVSDTENSIQNNSENRTVTSSKDEDISLFI